MKVKKTAYVLMALGFFTVSVEAAPLTAKEWEKCRAKAEASVDQMMYGVSGVESAIQEKCGTPPVNQAGTSKGVGVHPYDLVRSKTWKKKFVNITKSKYPEFVDNLKRASNTEQEGEWIFGEGADPMGGSAAFAINVKSGEVFGAMLDYDGKLFGFGFGSSWAKAPKSLQVWVENNKQ